MIIKPKLLFVLLFLITGIHENFGQYAVQEDKENILKAFPDQKCYAVKEEQNFEFEMKDNNLKIEENFSSTLFTNENETSRYQTIFYDNYSEVKKISCSADDKTTPEVNVIYTNYQNNGIFHDDLKLCAFKMNLKKNANYKVKYLKTYSNARFFTRFFFHENYPILEKTIKFTVPNWVKVDILPVNFNGYSIVETRKQNSNNTVTEITYTLKNLMNIPDENHAPGLLKYLPHLLVFVKSYDTGKESVTFFANHSDVYKWNKGLINEIENKEDELKPILKSIVKNETDSFKIMEKIFYWVRDNVRYIAFEDGIMGYKPASADKVCNLLYGDCKGMANLTKTLLKMAGFDSRLTWIGTDNIPYDNNLPTLAVYNHMICTVIFKNKKYFLDATESYIAIDDYAERIQSRPCMIDNGNDFIIEKIPDLNYERNLQNETYSLKIKDNLLVGNSQNTFNGETKTDFLRHFNDMRIGNKEAALNRYLCSSNLNLSVKNITTSDINERAIPLKINYDFNLKNALLQASDNEVLVFINKNKDLSDLFFDSTRVCDYVFNSKYYINTNCNFEIPVNYQLKKIPESLSIDNSNFSFNFKYEQKNGVVVLSKIIKIKKAYLLKNDFIAWNEAILKAKLFYNSPLILTKN